MKKLLTLCLALALALAALPALADATAGTLPWTIVEMDRDAVGDFDNDDTTEAFHFVSHLDEYGDGGFTLTVGGSSAAREDCYFLLDTVFAMRVGWTGGSLTEEDYYATLFMVPEYGMSDDPYSYCYLYAYGELIDVGAIPAVPGDMAADPLTGVITTRVRADMIGTWSRPADFILARGSSWDEEDFYFYYHLAEVPRPIYPLGMIVTLRQELPLLASQTDRVFSASLFPTRHEQVILVATDDRRWLYVSSLDGLTAGWVKMSYADYEQRIAVGDIDMNVNDVFGNIFYAD